MSNVKRGPGRPCGPLTLKVREITKLLVGGHSTYYSTAGLLLLASKGDASDGLGFSRATQTAGMKMAQWCAERKALLNKDKHQVDGVRVCLAHVRQLAKLELDGLEFSAAVTEVSSWKAVEVKDDAFAKMRALVKEPKAKTKAVDKQVTTVYVSCV